MRSLLNYMLTRYASKIIIQNHSKQAELPNRALHPSSHNGIPTLKLIGHQEATKGYICPPECQKCMDLRAALNLLG